MAARRDNVIVPATLDDVRDGSAVNFQAGGNVPAEIRRSDHNQTTTWVSRGVAKRDCGKEDNSYKKSADVAG
jgi:hypothetical protein